MGMYTGLRFSGIVKKEYREDIRKITEGARWEECENEMLNRFRLTDRSNFIPNGALCYMPMEWEDPNALADAEYDFNNRINMETGLWNFQCSLKNYSNTIEIFLKYVAAEICEAVNHAEVFYEEDEYSTFYKFEPECEVVDGKAVVVSNNVVIDEKRKIRYGYYEDEKEILESTEEKSVESEASHYPKEKTKKGFVSSLLNIICGWL